MPEDDGYRLAEEDAVFCRLEHVVPWAMNETNRGALAPRTPAQGSGSVVDGSCSWCEQEGISVTLVRHRGEHRIPDGFCSVEHLRAWAAAGGRWAAR